MFNRHFVLMFTVLMLLATSVPAQDSAPKPPPGVSEQLQSILGGALSSSPSGGSAPAGATRFAPSGELLFFDSMVAQMTLNPEQKTQFRAYAAQLLKLVDKAYTQHGFERNDLGVALGAFLETCYDMHHGTFRIAEPTEEEKNKTRAAVRQMQRALGGIAAFKALPDRSKQTAYEAASFASAHLAVMWQQAGGDATKQNELRQLARQQILGLFRVDLDQITRNAAGEFVPKSGGAATNNAGTTPAPANSVWKNTGSGARPASTQPAQPGVQPTASNNQPASSAGVAGWNSRQLTGGVTSYAPTALRAGEEYTIAFYPPQSMGGKRLNDWLLAAIENDPHKPGAMAMEAKISGGAGANAVAGVTAFTTPAGARHVAIYTALPIGDGNVCLIRIVSSGGALFDQYKAETESLMNSVIGGGK